MLGPSWKVERPGAAHLVLPPGRGAGPLPGGPCLVPVPVTGGVPGIRVPGGSPVGFLVLTGLGFGLPPQAGLFTRTRLIVHQTTGDEGWG